MSDLYIPTWLIDDVISSSALPASRPRPEHLGCSVCGGSFRSPLSVVADCGHCNGVGLEPKRIKIDLEKFCSHDPLPGYDREARYKRHSKP